MRLSTLFTVAATIVSVVTAAPQTRPELISRDLNIAQIINLLGIGLVSKVNTYILVRIYYTRCAYYLMAPLMHLSSQLSTITKLRK